MAAPLLRRAPHIAALAAASALALPLAGCGGERSAERPEVIEAYGLEARGDSLGTRLHFFTWPDYMDPALIAEFERVYGVRVVTDYYDNNEALIAKLRAGGTGQYDVIVASDYAVEVLAGDRLLQPLERERLPNLANLAPMFRGLPFDPDNTWSVCYQWGTSGLGIRTDRIEAGGDLDTWRLVFDPAAGRGPFTMLDDPRETIGAALIYLGYSVNTTAPAELEAAERLLLAQRPRLLAYAPFASSRDLLASADAVVTHNYSGDVLMARDEVEGIRFVIPREGSILWTDNLAIPAGAPNRYAAQVFINFLLDAEVGGRLTNFTRYASPNAAARPFIRPEILADPAIYPDSAVLGRLQLLRDVGPARRLYDRIWTRLRAGGA